MCSLYFFRQAACAVLRGSPLMGASQPSAYDRETGCIRERDCGSNRSIYRTEALPRLLIPGLTSDHVVCAAHDWGVMGTSGIAEDVVSTMDTLLSAELLNSKQTNFRESKAMRACLLLFFCRRGVIGTCGIARGFGDG